MFGLVLPLVQVRAALAQQQAGTNQPIKRIVLLFSDEVTVPGNVRVDRGLRTGFAKDPSFRTEFFQEYLDLTRFGGEAYDQRLAGVLSQKYGGRQPDLLVSVAPLATIFAARWAPIVFPGVPIVYVCPSRATVSALGPGFNATGVLGAFDVRGTVQAALRLRPWTRRVVVVSGATRADHEYLEIVRVDLTELERQVRVEYLVALPMSELLDRVARLPQDTVILYMSIFRDGTGQDFQPPDALEMVAARSAVPVFGPAETFLGRGIVGGHLFSWEDAGARAAGLALRVLHGTSPRDLPPSSEGLSSWLFDARRLKRWGIPESALPPGSEVRFKEASLWREHPWLTLGAVLFSIAETLLLAGLVVERLGRRRAEETQRLLSAIVESSNDAIIAISPDRRIVSWNNGAVRLFGYDAAEVTGGEVDLLVPPDRLHEAHSAFEGAMAGGTVTPFETVRVRKDGTLVDVSINDSPIRDRKGRIVGISSTQRELTEIKKMQRQIATAAAEWQSTFDSIQDQVMLLDRDHRVLRANHAAAEFLALPPERIRGQPCHALMHGTDEPHADCPLPRLFASKVHAEEEMFEPSRGLWLLVSVDPILDAQGEIAGIVHTVKDITERKRAENAVRTSEEKFRQFFKEVPDYCYIVSPEGTILDINSAALRALGYRREEIVGAPLKTIYAPECHPRMMELFAQWKETGLIVDEEIVIVSKSGERRVVILNVGAERDHDGDILRSTSVQTDITERKRAEAELRQSQALVTAVFSSLYGNVVVLDRNGAIVTANEAWERFSHENGADLATTGVGVNYLQVCRRAEAAGDRFAGEALAAVQSVLDGSREELRLEYACPSPSGDRWYEMVAVALKRPEGGAVVAHVDISSRKQAEIEARSLQQELSHFARVSMMGELTASLAHELNQPLTAILSNAQAAERLLADGKADLDEFREILTDIVADDERAGGIIRRLRTLMKKGEVELHDLDLNELVRDVVGLIRSDAIIRNISVTLDLAGDLPIVRGDRTQLQQVMLNLILNAMDALTTVTGTDRRIVVHTRTAADGSVQVAVHDSGPGIPPDALERVFEPFFSTKKDGMGMGLAIARSILRAHAGRLWAESSPGKGSTFTLALPSVQ